MRQGIPHVDDFIHLNNAAGSLPDKRIYDAVAAHLALEAENGSTEAMTAAAGELDRLYSAAATLVSGSPEQIIITDSHTNAWQKPFLAIDLAPGDVVLAGTAEWGGNLSMIHHACRRMGASYKIIPDDESGRMDLQALEDALKDERVKLVCATWVAATSGLVNPVREIGNLVAGTQALYFIDGAQAIGQFPVDIRDLGCDVLTTSARKFLRAPRGTGFGWISRRFLDRHEPVGVDQFSAPWTGREPALRQDARRFETGESNYAARLGLLAALELASGRDSAADYTAIRKLARQARERLADIPGVTVLEDDRFSCGLVTFHCDRMEPAKLAAALRERRINIAAPTSRYAPISMQKRGFGAINRLSPHAFNTPAEVDTACDAIVELIFR